MAASVLLLCLFCLGSAEAGKLLVVPSDGSHWTGMKPLVEELGRRGNQVVVVIPEASLSMGPSQHTTTLTYPVPYTKTQLQEHVTAGVITLTSEDLSTDLARYQSFLKTMDLLNALINRNVEVLLSNEALMNKLQDYNFDAILTDPFEPVGTIAAEAGKLLVIPSDGSHWLGMKPIVEELGRRGNQVVVVIPEASLSMGPSQNTTTLTYPVNYTKDELEADLADQLNTILSIDMSTDLAKFQVFIISLDILQSFIVRNAEGLLFNRDLMKKLQDYNFDAILTDPFEPIGAIAGEYLSVPAIYMQINLPCGVDALASQCPVPASYVPQPLTHFTDHMSLWQRSVNLVRTLLQAMACRHLFTCADEIASRLLQRKASMVEIMSRAALWFMRFDFALEIPRPLMPNMIMIGGMATKKPKPLSQYWLECDVV
ncbi:UDP-glucuronosyltransferase 1-5 [Pimephales promelas]|nr:UDP-glucuronosyltransferase 1-5 [Pimephales promelas]